MAAFIKMPDVRARPPRAPQSSGVLRADVPRPEADGFVKDLNPLGQHQFRHVTWLVLTLSSKAGRALVIAVTHDDE